ncbi:hypothetical protein [Halorubrum tropicale]|uniref:Uncharacterized protein n=1 Tax=Halorubrum tropicale TaxID=1765655 RepID=A0A0M9AII1_9EURY|nr:hypothetical protein [Halorubrum tropicale]KOX92138.1 hypothetical protein AMR74_16965 [Halorubrum tropicale]
MTPETSTEEENEAGWEAGGRRMLQSRAGMLRSQITDAFYDVEEAARSGEEITEEEVRELRSALNQARIHVEEELAPIAGVESFGGPLPMFPNRALREMLGETLRDSEEDDGGDDE